MWNERMCCYFLLSFFSPIPFAYTSHLCPVCVYITITFHRRCVRMILYSFHILSHSFNFVLPVVFTCGSSFTFRFSSGSNSSGKLYFDFFKLTVFNEFHYFHWVFFTEWWKIYELPPNINPNMNPLSVFS